MDHSNRLFRKAVFGGFNKDDVIDYIESMKNEFFEYKKQVEETINELNQKIAELEQIASAAAVAAEAAACEQNPVVCEESGSDQQSGVDFSVTAINAATNHLKETADKLCENLTDFMEKISSSCISVTVEAPVSDASGDGQETSELSPDPTDPINDTAGEGEKPSSEEIAAAYQQAIQIRGNCVLSDTFGQSDESTPTESASSFSQLLDSILYLSRTQDAPAQEEKKPEEPSILDDLLSSSRFFC